MMVFYDQNGNFTKKLAMNEASVSEVLQVILVILLIYFGLKILIRWFGPLLLKFVLRKIGKEFEKKFSQYDPAGNTKKDKKQGKTTLEKKPKNKRKSNKDVGEYIDYEEID